MDEENLHPVRDILLIKVDPPKTKTASGFLIQEEWKTLPPVGVIVAVGPEVKQPLKIGDRVLFERYASVILRNDYRLCKESHVIAVFDGGYDPDTVKFGNG